MSSGLAGLAVRSLDSSRAQSYRTRSGTTTRTNTCLVYCLPAIEEVVKVFVVLDANARFFALQTFMSSTDFSSIQHSADWLADRTSMYLFGRSIVIQPPLQLSLGHGLLIDCHSNLRMSE